MKTKNVNLEDIIFENRNKDYGAYVLRKNYNKNMISAIIIAVVIFLSGISIPLIAGLFKTEVPIKDDRSIEGVIINPPKEIPEIKLPELPKELPKITAFRPPVIVANPDEVTDDLAELIENAQNENLGETGEIEISDTIKTRTIIDEGEALKIHTIVEEMPEFPGGEKERIKFLTGNMHYPDIAKEMGIQGPVYLTFIIEKDGTVTGVNILRGIGGGCDEEASRVVNMMPKWTPGRQNGKEVRVQFNMPVLFTLK
ncbi:MAG: energy transducer TonB [Bacteroidales bacterium]|jgi:protein TonB|nr:energy transducer TonB [Bacteroidales bacterium]